MNMQLPAFLQHPLAREIALAIVIKLVVIGVLFFAFFDGHAVPTDPAAVAERLIASPPSSSKH
ncbi:MAG: cytochrome oxidase putative small subunit CydP [Thiobacillus sp.]